MSREIKFRAWDKKAVIMRDDGTHPTGQPHMKYDVGVMAADARHEWATGIDGIEIRVNSESFEIMQFTGLKDKNGKEIYEGDIVKYILAGVMPEDEGTEYIEEVSFVDGCFCVDGYTPVSVTTDWGVKVIGNIYDNPELLKS